MLNISLQELKQSEGNRVEDYGWSIANRLRFDSSVDASKVICAAYVAYLAKENGIDESDSLLRFIEDNLPEEQVLFIKDSLNGRWEIVIEISKEITSDGLLGVVLLLPVSGKYGAEFETPESLVNLAIKILDPQKGENIADFCSGSGCFLKGVAEYQRDCFLQGIEIHTYSKAISTIRLSLLSDLADIQQGSVFDIGAEVKYNKIFCNYPWGLRNRDAWIDTDSVREMENALPDLKKSTIADWHFIVNVVNHLEENGKAVVVVTNGITWNGGVSRIIRAQLLKEGYIEAVISLSTNLYPATSIPTTFLVLSKGNKSVRMIDAGALASVGRRQNMYSDSAIDEIVRLLNEDTDNSQLVSLEMIEADDYAINPGRYLETEVVVEDGVPFENVIKNITRGAQIKASDLDNLVSEEPTDYQYLMLANIQDGQLSDDLPYLKELDKKNEKYCIKNNSLVISKNGAPVKIAVVSVEDGKKILANGNLYVVELDETRANPYFVKAYLESENGTIALSRITVGTSIPNIPVDSLKSLLIPLPDIKIQNELAEKYLAKQDELKILKYRIAKVTSELKNIFEEG